MITLFMLLDYTLTFSLCIGPFPLREPGMSPEIGSW